MLEPLFKEYQYILVTEKTGITEKMADQYPMRYLKYGSRNFPFRYLFVFLYNVCKCLQIVLSFKPETVVTTGAHTGGIMCFVAKLFGAKIIYIESLAKTQSLSMTGKNVYRFADKFYVQWESLAKKYPKAEYLGRLI